ncbi:MAG: histidinol-phosphate transaminase [Pseudomonadota bacterium]|nr:histidinol-phosphate transaminase [Pseudomonadota bacterium]
MIELKIENLIKPSINEIEKYLPGQSKIDGKKNIIKLSSNESPFQIPKRVCSKLREQIFMSNIYPDGDSSELKKALAREFGLKTDQILCGNGSDDILSVIAQSFSKENSEIICSEFGFIYYPIIAKAAGCKVVTAKSANLSISCENIIKKITKKTKIIFLANPNNPTGTIIFRDELDNFLRKIPENIIVVIDGAYSEFITDKRYSNGFDFIKKYNNLIVTRTFSKIFALAGLRLGWAYSNKEIIEILEKVRGPFNVNSIAQHIGSMILKEKKFLDRSIKHNNKWQRILPEEINRIGFRAYKTHANFVLVKVDPEKFSKKKIINYLKKKKIVIRDLRNYGLNDFFRVSIGTTPHLKKFLKELKNSIKKN